MDTQPLSGNTHTAPASSNPALDAINHGGGPDAHFR